MASAGGGAGRRRVVLLAALGYGYIALVLAALVGSVAACAFGVATGHPVLLKLAFPLALVVVAIVRAFAVNIAPPEGHDVRPDEAAALWQATSNVGAALDAPGIDRVVVTDDVNAAVAQIPRLGLLGWTRSYLILGLPLMRALSPLEFRAVLAHELAHLSRKHGRYGAWVYRTRARWAQILASLEARQSIFLWILAPLFLWLVPRFDRASLAASRAHEFEADAAAAEIAGADALADALVAATVAAPAADEYWESVWQRVTSEPEPPRDAPTELGRSMTMSRLHPLAEIWIETALDGPADAYDSHPSLAERLDALGEDAPDVVRRRRAPNVTAADELLGDLASLLDHRFADVWTRAVGGTWDMRHREALVDRARLQKLAAIAPGDLDGEQALDLARLSTTYDEDAAPARWQRALALRPDEPEAVYHHARALLAAGDDRGLDELVRVSGLDPDATVPAFVVAASYLAEHDREAEIPTWSARFGIDAGSPGDEDGS